MGLTLDHSGAVRGGDPDWCKVDNTDVGVSTTH